MLLFVQFFFSNKKLLYKILKAIFCYIVKPFLPFSPWHRSIYFKLCLGPGVCFNGSLLYNCQNCPARPVRSWKEFHFKSGLSSCCQINLFLNCVPSSDSENFDRKQYDNFITFQSDQSPAGQFWRISAPRKGFNLLIWQLCLLLITFIDNYKLLTQHSCSRE